MAEGGAEASAAAYLEVTADMCDVCLDDDNRHGTWFCQQCKQRLCDKCRKYHEKVSTTKNHTLIRADEIPVRRASLEQHEGVSDEVRAPMCQLHNLHIEFYCEKHNKTICYTCKLMEHRKCKLQDLEQAASEMFDDYQVFHKLTLIKCDMEQIEQVMEKEIEELVTQKDAAIEKIKMKMKDIEVLGQKKIAEVEDKFEQETVCLNREKRALAQSSDLVRKGVKELEQNRQVGSKEEIFVATKWAAEDLSKFQDILCDSNRVSHAEISFETDSTLAECTSIGTITVERSSFMVDLVLKDTTWIDILPNQQMLRLGYVDRGHISQLSLFSASQRLLSQVDLPEMTVSAATINDHQIIVALPDQPRLQIVNLSDDNLTLGPKIGVHVDVRPKLILKYSDSSVLILAESNEEGWRLQILDLAGKVQKNVKLSTSLWFPLSVKLSYDRNEVYVVDLGKGCFGFNMKGDLIFHYAQSYISTEYWAEYWGLAIDQHGNIIFSVGCVDHAPTLLIKMSRTAKSSRKRISIVHTHFTVSGPSCTCVELALLIIE